MPFAGRPHRTRVHSPTRTLHVAVVLLFVVMHQVYTMHGAAQPSLARRGRVVYARSMTTNRNYRTETRTPERERWAIYATSPAGTVHLRRHNLGGPCVTLCGRRLGDGWDDDGDETKSGRAATCGVCKTRWASTRAGDVMAADAEQKDGVS